MPTCLQVRISQLQHHGLSGPDNSVGVGVGRVGRMFSASEMPAALPFIAITKKCLFNCQMSLGVGGREGKTTSD